MAVESRALGRRCQGWPGLKMSLGGGECEYVTARRTENPNLRRGCSLEGRKAVGTTVSAGNPNQEWGAQGVTSSALRR